MGIMKTKMLRNIASLALAAAVLVATGGFSVFRHSCHTAQTTEFSFFIPDFSCKHGHFHPDAQPVACCTQVGPEDTSACTAGDCCDTEAFFVKLHIDTDTPVKHKNFAPVLIADLEPNESLPWTEEREAEHIMVSNDLPPPLSGKALHIYLQQLNIPFPVV